MFIKLLLEYVRYNFKSTKEQFPDINDKTLKSALVYRYVHFYYLERDISIYEILEIEGSDSLGLIGPGSGRLTRLLEFIFGWSDVFSNHTILHDAFGRFYTRFHDGNGYTYCINRHVPDFVKKSPLFGHLTGLIYCAFKRLTI